MNQAIRERTKWFMDARFGMFIHWGIYAIPACGEWVMSEENQYHQQDSADQQSAGEGFFRCYN